MIIFLLILLLISNAISTRRDKTILYSRLTLNSLLVSAFLAYDNLYVKPLESGIGIYGGLFNVTTFTQSFNIFILLISAIILSLTAFYPRKIHLHEDFSILNVLSLKLSYDKDIICNKNHEQFRILEYSLIITFILCGAIFLISSADLISVFLSIELQSYGLYVLSTLYRDSESATASGLMYFLLGGFSSCFILLGSALLYANTGTSNLDNIYIITGISEINMTDNGASYIYDPYYFHSALIIMSIGLLFKISAAPFHFWSPDVYDGIPTIVTTYVAIVAKISILAFLLELVYYTEYYLLTFSWKDIFIFSSLFSLIIGSILGLSQFRIKRLLAYSTISHIGFILLALSINTTESIQAYIFYILQYTICNLNAFIILISIGFSLYVYTYKAEINKEERIDETNSPIQVIDQIRGYFYINPFIALSLSITLFSFVGIPPIIGFFAKQMIISAALDSGYIFMTLIAILTSVIGAAYYLNLIKQIFFFKDNYKLNPIISNLKLLLKIVNNNVTDKTSINNKTKVITCESITTTSSLSVTISTLTLLLMSFIFVPAQWLNNVTVLALVLFRA